MMTRDLAILENVLYGLLMLLAAVSIACSLIALAQRDVGWSLLLAAVACGSFEAGLLITEESDYAN